jgi:hypothetical protein
VLNRFGGDFVRAEMVKAFISSTESADASATERASVLGRLTSIGESVEFQMLTRE